MEKILSAFLVASVWILVIPFARCAKSTLKVAVCNPGQVPYATVQDNGTLNGYDVGKCLSCPNLSCLAFFMSPLAFAEWQTPTRYIPRSPE